MPALLIALLALVPAGALLLRVNLRRFRFRLDQFRPAAPLTGPLPTDRDSQRQHNDLRAAARPVGRARHRNHYNRAQTV